MNTEDNVRISFKLNRQGGYPPVNLERLWAVPLSDGTFRLDNIPFYARLVSYGDVVDALDVAGELYFSAVLVAGGHSTVRVIMYEESQVDAVRSGLESLGCATELSNVPTFFSVDVPPEVDFSGISKFLGDFALRGALDYEEASLQHGSA